MFADKMHLAARQRHTHKHFGDFLLMPVPLIKFEPVNRCIYCGTTEGRLTDEHIVPLSLNGTMLLQKASCDKCAGTTSAFELKVARPMYGNLRAKLGYSSRRKRVKSVTIFHVEDGQEVPQSVDIVDLPNLYLVGVFPLPGIFTNQPLTENNPPFQIDHVGDISAIDTLLKKTGSENVQLVHTFYWGPLYRLLAKIAHGFVVAQLGFHGYEPLLPELILGTSPYLSHYIGGNGINERRSLEDYHLEIQMVEICSQWYLVVLIHLLGGASLPVYQVVAGRVTDFHAVLSKRNPAHQ
jgi:hypothetical protein